MTSVRHSTIVALLITVLSALSLLAGGLRAVAQIEDGAVGLGMTTFVSKVQSITQRQKVQSCTKRSTCFGADCMHAHTLYDASLLPC